MKTRPYIVTASCVINTDGFYRVADAIAARMRGQMQRPAREMIRTSRLLLRVMAMIADITLRNNCFIRRAEVLASPKLRSRVLDALGGAHAAERWRRKAIWNKGREACIASGEVPDPRLTAGSVPVRAKVRPKPAASGRAALPAPRKASGGYDEFRFPALRDWNRIGKPIARAVYRVGSQARYPSIVVWPHQLDGQYVPNFKSRATRPASGGYPPYAGAACGASRPARIAPAPP